MRTMVAITLAALTIFALPTTGFVSAQEKAEEKKTSPINSGLISALKLRSIGPAFMSGRIGDIAVDPTNPNVWYVAAGSGNLWKTTNAGTTWTPIFDNYGSYSIGCVTLDPSNSSVVWVGTGENVGGRHIGFGDGVYKSTDGGRTFKNMGLKKSEHISKIVVDPRNPKVVYVASQGPLWSGGGERGVYKTTDGGKSWKNVLSKGKFTGATDIVIDPKNPNVLYAATHQRLRTVWALLNAGPESGIFKSVDAGLTWTELKSGLPGGDKGKISLGVSPQKSNVVYATIELAGRVGGFWRSADFGATWTKQSDYVGGGTGPHYYQEIYLDPHRFDVIYHANVVLGRSTDGGKTFSGVGNQTKHVDNHAVAFSPTDPNMLLVGCDGGLYKSYDQGKTYAFTANLPLTQFYKVDVDYDYPFYNVVGGTQDNNTQYGPAATGNLAGIRNGDWRITIGGDGHDCAIDPKDPNTIYCESQQGFLRRYDRRTGESVDIRPQPAKGEEDLRFNWDSPIHISPHNHKRIYHASKKLHRSDDRGDSWTAISPDLSRNQNRFELKMMDRVWSIDAAYDLFAMSQYGNITSVSESPVVKDLIYVGTDDGLIQVTEDGGKTWRKIDKVYGVPEFFFVNDIKADLFDADTVYACVDQHKIGDYKPYIIKSTDRGKTWTSMSGDLKENHICWRIIQDHVKKDLFFAATEYGVFTSINGGKNWMKVAGSPVISFRDLEIQRRENDLVCASFGRSFYVLDDYTPLRELTEESLKEDIKFFPVKKSLLYIPQDQLGGRKGWQGDSFYTAPNPTYGTVFTYHLKDSLKSKSAKRKAAEAKIKAAGGDQKIPGWDELRAESQEESPKLTFVIKDAKENVVSYLNAPSSSGMHRVSWNLRYTTLTGGRFGPYVAPGTFTATAFKRVGETETQIGEPATFEVGLIDDPSLPKPDRMATLAYQEKAAKLYQSILAADQRLQNALTQVGEIKTAITGSKTGRELYNDARKMELSLQKLQLLLEGDDLKDERSQVGPISIIRRCSNSLFGTFRTTYGPTGTQKQQFEIAKEEFAPVLKSLEEILDSELPALNAKLDAAGVPWTRGRKIPR